MQFSIANTWKWVKFMVFRNENQCLGNVFLPRYFVTVVTVSSSINPIKSN